MVEVIRPYYSDFESFEEKAAKKHLRPVAKEPLETVKLKLAELSEWAPEAIHAAINETAEQLEVGMGKVGMPLRVAATGAGMSPSLDITLNWIGKDKTIQRIDLALDFIKQREQNA